VDGEAVQRDSARIIGVKNPESFMSQMLRKNSGTGEQPRIVDEAAEPEASVGFRDYFFRRVPGLAALYSYSFHSLQLDTIAGLTVALVAVPQAMAYATVAGIPPQHGLYTAIVMTAVASVLNSSRQLINGPTNAISIAVLSALAPIAGPDEKIQAAVILALLVGLIQLGITVLRLGDLTRYISHAVIVGFTLGAAVLLVLDQTKNLLGLEAQGGAGAPFLKRFWLTIQHWEDVNAWSVAIGIGSIALVLGLRWLNDRLRGRIPVPIPELFITVILMACVAWLFGLEGGLLIETIPRELPPFQWPHPDWGRIPELSRSALAIAILGLLEALAMAKVIAVKTGQRISVNQQCLSEGMANFVGSFFHCYPGSGSLTRSAINHQAGAVTQWSGVFSAAAVAAMVLLLAPLGQYIPKAALAGILMVSAWRIVDRKELRYYLRATRFDAGIVVATALTAIFLSVEFCILIGVFLSFVLYVPRAARIQITELVLTPERVVRERTRGLSPCGRMLIFNVEGELFFGASASWERQLGDIWLRARDDPGVRILILRLKRVRNPDAVCLQILESFIQKMEARQVTVLLCGVRPDMAKTLQTTGILYRLGHERVFLESPHVWSSTLDAVRYAYDLLKGDICATCPRRSPEEASRETWYYMI
jgi:sulfate permease, SulP family